VAVGVEVGVAEEEVVVVEAEEEAQNTLLVY
jgi:hypothetical protein